jgi:hypothetical protein
VQLHGLAESQRWNRSRTGSCGNEPPGDRPGGSFTFEFARRVAARIAIAYAHVDAAARLAPEFTPSRFDPQSLGWGEFSSVNLLVNPRGVDLGGHLQSSSA